MSLVNLKRIARYKVTINSANGEDEMAEFLMDWWSEKYNLPNNHPLLLQKTLEELVVEYYVDVFKKNPDELSKFEKDLGVAKEDEDEKWFKKMMGEQYTSEPAYSEGFGGKAKEQPKEDEAVFEDTYNTLGN